LAGCSEEQLYRFGTGVSYHEFDLFLENKDGQLPAIIGGGWDMWAAFDEPLRPEEVELEGYMRDMAVPAHPSFARYWIDVVFDLSRVLRPEAYVRPVLLGAQPSTRVERTPGHRWTLPNYRSAGAEIEFDLCGRTPKYVQLDLNGCSGGFTITSENGGLARGFSVDALRVARFARWHSRAQIDLSAFKNASRVIFRPAQTGDRLALEGLVAA
jgi:hypothetical protein